MLYTTQQIKFTNDVARLIQKAQELKIGLTMGEAYRTTCQQLLYFHGYRVWPEGKNLTLKKDKVRSKTILSRHLQRLAIDFNFFINYRLTYDDPLIKELGAYWESLSEQNRWGGNYESFTDVAHFERLPDTNTNKVVKMLHAESESTRLQIQNSHSASLAA